MAAPPPNLPIIAPNPVDTPELYEQFKLQGQWSPGICKFDPPPARVTGWDIQAPSGGGGGWTLKHKEPPISFSVKIRLWKGDDAEGGDVDHFAPWESFKAIFATPIKRNSPRALAIYHPQLAGLRPPVTDVVIADFTEPAPDDSGSGWVTIKFDEYRPFTIKPVKPLTGSALNKSDPNAEWKQKVELAGNEFKDPGTLSAAERSRIGL